MTFSLHMATALLHAPPACCCVSRKQQPSRYKWQRALVPFLSWRMHVHVCSRILCTQDKSTLPVGNRDNGMRRVQASRQNKQSCKLANPTFSSAPSAPSSVLGDRGVSCCIVHTYIFCIYRLHTYRLQFFDTLPACRQRVSRGRGVVPVYASGTHSFVTGRIHHVHDKNGSCVPVVLPTYHSLPI